MPYPKFDYPKPLREEGGCKVGWMYFETQEDAERASKAAIAEADHKSMLGYDFGFCVPGEIHKTHDGLWVVTIP